MMLIQKTTSGLQPDHGVLIYMLAPFIERFVIWINHAFELDVILLEFYIETNCIDLTNVN